MQPIHVPTLGVRYWFALCLASIFGANMGDFFAHDLGLGHVAGLPFLAVALLAVLIAERFERRVHEAYYWLAIVIVRTAATNSADFLAGDMKWPRPWVMAALAVLLALAVAMAWRLWWRHKPLTDAEARGPLRADYAYWFAMFVAGTLGTVMGDYGSHNLHLGDALSAVALSAPLVVLFVAGRYGLLSVLGFYWLTIVLVRAAGTNAGDFLASRHMLGLAASTVVTGVIFIAVLLAWRANGRIGRLASP